MVSPWGAMRHVEDAGRDSPRLCGAPHEARVGVFSEGPLHPILLRCPRDLALIPLQVVTMVETPAFMDGARPDVPDIRRAPRRHALFPAAAARCAGASCAWVRWPMRLLGRHENPDLVTALAGQALALVAALASALKFRGSFSLQAKGDGPGVHAARRLHRSGRAARLCARGRGQAGRLAGRRTRAQMPHRSVGRGLPGLHRRSRQ